MADGYLNFDTKINEQGFNDGISKLSGLGKSGLSAISKAMTGAIAAVGAGTTAIVKSSLDVVANMEQQVGGIETLFKNSADTVIANANRAYKTAGLSANAYMETATSFSASLLQSLSGDTAKAAAYADKAITDMSDNANKMGTNMQDIQNAYQGFAKQNYTMLDNLKLGYGGTKSEMERLIVKANELRVAQGEAADLTIDSYADIIEAIHLVQDDLDITGTTAAEAEKTIEGSVASAKAAWENFEAGVISANDLVDTFWIAASNIFKNLEQIIPRLGETGAEVVSALAQKIGEAVPQVQGFTDSISSLADKLKGMDSEQLLNLGKMALVIAGSAPALSVFGSGIETVRTATSGFNGLIDGVVTSFGKFPAGITKAGSAFKTIGGEFKNLGSALALPFQDLGAKISPHIKNLGGIMSNMWASGPGGKLTGAIANTVKNLGGAFGGIGTKLASAFPGITSKMGELGTKLAGVAPKITGALGGIGTKISGYAGVIGDAFSPILSKAATFAPTFLKLMNIAGGIGIVVAGLGLLYSQFGDQIDQILLMMQTKGPEVITNFCNGITAALPNLIAQGATLLNNLMTTITANLPAIVTGGISIVTSLISGIGQQLPTLIPTALNMILTLVTSLLSNVGQIVDAGINLLTGLAQGLANALPTLINQAPTIIGQLATAIITNLPKILQAGIQIISILANGVIQAVPQLIAKIPSIINSIKNAFTSVDWGSVGRNIVSGIANGLKNAGGKIAEAAKNAASSALNAAKDFLGIHSPSRVFRDQVGKMMALGMGIGFEGNIPIKSMSAGVQQAISGLQNSADIAMSARTTDKTVGGVKGTPGFNDDKEIDYDRLEKIQMKTADKILKRPIYLGTKRIDEALPEGAIPSW